MARESCRLCPICLPCLLKEAERDHARKLLHSPNFELLPERGLHLAEPYRLALNQGQDRQALYLQPMAIDGTELQMGGNAAEVQQEVRRGAGAEA